MTILFISNQSDFTKDDAFKLFQPYTERRDLHHFKSLSKAKDFLIKHLIEKNKHLDFIIADWKFQYGNSKTILNWIRESLENYSSSNFQLKSIPFLLIEDKENQSATISDGFDAVIENFPNGYVNLKYNITSAVKSWRTSLADDLELIGLDPKTKTNNLSHRKSFFAFYKLKILSKVFVENSSNSLNYIWTNFNHTNLVNSSDLFERKMKETLRKPTKYLEKEFHEFLRDNPTFVKGESYNKLLYEKHLYINNTRRYNEPDFINKPFDYAIRLPEIFEVKRQSQRLFWKNKVQLLSKAIKGFEQVMRYKNYMESKNEANEYFIKKYLGKVYNQYEYTLLMGSSEEKRYNENLIEDLKSDFNFTDVSLVTYEELLNKHIRLCDRLNNFNVF